MKKLKLRDVKSLSSYYRATEVLARFCDCYNCNTDAEDESPNRRWLVASLELKREVGEGRRRGGRSRRRR